MKKAKTKHQLIEDIVNVCTNQPSSCTLDIIKWVHKCEKEEYFMTDLISLIDEEKIKKYIRGLLTCRISEQELIDYILEENDELSECVDIYDYSPRSLFIGQRVFDVKNMCYGTILLINGKYENKNEVNEDTDMITVLYDKSLNNDLPDTDIVQPYNLYIVPSDIKKRITCPQCGNILLDEHRDDLDYEYYCPHCDENFY